MGSRRWLEMGGNRYWFRQSTTLAIPSKLQFYFWVFFLENCSHKWSKKHGRAFSLMGTLLAWQKKSILSFVLFCIYKVRNLSSGFLFCFASGCLITSVTFVEKAILPLLNFFCICISSAYLCRSPSGFLSLFLWSLCLYYCLCCAVLITRAMY